MEASLAHRNRGRFGSVGVLIEMGMSHLSKNTAEAAALLAAMANPKRLMILLNLVEGEMPVGALAAQVGLSQSALSQHLSKLRARNLVSTRRDAQSIYYSTNSEAVLKILETLDHIYGQARNSKSAA